MVDSLARGRKFATALRYLRARDSCHRTPFAWTRGTCGRLTQCALRRRLFGDESCSIAPARQRKRRRYAVLPAARALLKSARGSHTQAVSKKY